MKKIVVVSILILSIFLVGCSDTKTSSGSNTISIGFDADKGCTQDKYVALSGSIEVTAKNEGSDVGELEILDGDRIKGEAENIISGVAKKFTVKLDEGEYVIYCGRKQAKRATLTVEKNSNATDSKASEDIIKATAQYKDYVIAQTVLLETSVKALTDAVRAGEIEAAKQAFGPSREPWERIEPIAELFAKYDGVIDSRVDDFLSETDPEFTGFHRIEYSIFELNTTDGISQIADKLDGDILALTIEIKALDIDPFDMAKGPQILMEEIANGKITGEEDRYSGTDLFDFNANIEGSKAIVDFLRPALLDVKSDLAKRYDELNTKIVDRINKYRNTDGTYQNYKMLTEQDKNQFKADVASASELLAELPGVLGLK